MRFNASSVFLNGRAAELLRYLQASTLKTICGGDLLRQVILCIVKPPLIWSMFVKAYRDGSLEGRRCSVICLTRHGAPLGSHREILGLT
jgi:hypothetical protein